MSRSGLRRSFALWSVLALGLLLLAGACGTPQVPATGAHEMDLVTALRAYVAAEMEDKRIPGLSIALVEGGEIVWAEGFGLADPARGTPASADTVYRVGSVSKLFTDLAVMQLVERGQVDLDAPVQTYLPEFAPRNPFGGALTLRQLMSHRAGLVREPPVGHYFDPSEPSLAATVASLNGTELVYAPGTRLKYSNAGIAVVGAVVERLGAEPFAAAVQRTVLQPMGLADSAFVARPELAARRAQGLMWSYDGREFVAPDFALGMAPAGSLYSTVRDLGRFLTVVFADGRGPGGALLAPATLAAMLTPQFAEPGARTGYGLGFAIGELEGHTSYGHGGAIYGFATQLQFLKDERLGVVVCANVDVVNSVTNRIARQALEWMLARRAGRPLAPASLPAPVTPEAAQALVGRYAHEGDELELEWREGELLATHGRVRVPVRRHGTSLRLDGRLALGPVLAPHGGGVRLGDVEYARIPAPKPAPAPERLRGLVGEYGWDHNVLFVFEREGRLFVLIEWIELDALTELGDGVGGDVFAFPADGGLYHGERLVFRRDARGRATAVEAAGILFERRAIQGEDAPVFTIEPVRPVEELRRAALAATPPAEPGEFLDSELVELVTLDPSLQLDVRYAGTDNFLRTRVYESARAFLQRPAAEALVRVHRRLGEYGYGLCIHDAYRPWYVTKLFWDATPAAQHLFVADPAEGSRHNRGCAVDLTLFERATGKPVEMVGLYDEMSARSYPDYVGGTALQRWHRDLLRTAMGSEGFRVYAYEWWHFDFQGWERYRIGNLAFEELAPGARSGR